MKNEFKVKADVGDEHGGGYYDIATFNSIALALIFISGLKPMIGYNMYIMGHILGVDENRRDITFKGLTLTKGDDETIEEFY